MRKWEAVEISVNKIDVQDVITTSYNTTDTPMTGGGTTSGSEDIMGSVRDN